MSGNLADLPEPAHPGPAHHEPVHPAQARKNPLSRRGFLLRSSLVAAGGMAFYSGEFARHEIAIVTQNLALANLPGAFENFRIAQISDIHFDEYTEPFFVRRVVEQVNSLAPDLVILTGDYVSDTPLPRRFAEHAMHHCAEILRGLACPQRFAVMGNHDDILGAPVIRDILATVPVPLLLNQHVPIERAGQRLWLSGLADVIADRPDLGLAIPERPDGPVLLLCHEPDYADDVLAHPRGHLVNAMLSGHSHGGQIVFPLVGALHYPKFGRKYIAGPYRLGRMQLYVNRGIGTVGVPFRLNCPPEITLFTLRKA